MNRFYRVPAEDGRKIPLDFKELKEADAGLRAELNQNIDIALGTEIVAQHRSIQRQAPNLVPAADLGQLCSIDGKMRRHNIDGVGGFTIVHF